MDSPEPIECTDCNETHCTLGTINEDSECEEYFVDAPVPQEKVEYVLYKFTAVWCGPCGALKAEMAATNFGTDVVIVDMDVSDPQSKTTQEAITDWKVSQIPVVVLKKRVTTTNPDGTNSVTEEKIERWDRLFEAKDGKSGAKRTVEHIKEWIDYSRKKDNDSDA